MDEYNKKFDRKISPINSNKKIIFFILLFCFLNSCSATSPATTNTQPAAFQTALTISSNKELNWYEFNADTFFKAKIKNRLIILFFWASNCQPCDKMEKTTFKDEKIISMLNNNFIPIKVNNLDNPEAVEALLDKQIYPNTVILSPGGEHVVSIPGYISPSNYSDVLEIIIKASK